MPRRVPHPVLSALLVATGAAGVLSISAAAGAGAADGARISVVSLDSDQAQMDDGAAATPSVSTDGQLVVFSSTSATLVPGDTNGHADVFVRDRTGRVTARVSVDCDGDQALGGDSLLPMISPDGRFVVYQSAATNLVGGDLNGVSDIFVHDLTTGLTQRVSVGADGAQAAVGDSVDASVSGDGRYVAFSSTAPNLAAGDLNGTDDVFVRDTVDGVTTLVSSTPSGRAGAGASSQPRISDDGRFVAFTSAATDLTEGITGSRTDVYVRDLTAGTTQRVSHGSSGSAAVGMSDQPAISADGSSIAYRTTAARDAADVAGVADIVVHDRVTGVATVVSSGSGAGGVAANGGSWEPAISGDGQVVAFSSDATTLVPGDVNGVTDVFVRDLGTDTTSVGSVTDSGDIGDGASGAVALSATGRYLAFTSAATTLVPGDRNDLADAFLVDRLPPPGRPTDVVAAVGEGQVTVSWAGPAEGSMAVDSYQVDSYQVDAVPVAGGVAGSCTTVAPVTSCRVTGLVNGQEYLVRVTASNASGAGESSVPVFVVPTTLVAGAPSIAAPEGPTLAGPTATGRRGSVGLPGAPDALVLTVRDSTLTASWAAGSAASGGSPVTGYVVSAVPPAPDERVGCQTAADVTTCQLGPLVAGVPYRVHVVALTTAGAGPASAAYTVQLAAVPPTSAALPSETPPSDAAPSDPVTATSETTGQPPTPAASSMTTRSTPDPAPLATPTPSVAADP